MPPRSDTTPSRRSEAGVGFGFRTPDVARDEAHGLQVPLVARLPEETALVGRPDTIGEFMRSATEEAAERIARSEAGDTGGADVEWSPEALIRV
ncbi:MAG: hypothetical protein JRH16_10885 [Deltaproteobacteria bacterium]|nr:hypothetical protein [Deltaproteobacteria bacterium]